MYTVSDTSQPSKECGHRKHRPRCEKSPSVTCRDTCSHFIISILTGKPLIVAPLKISTVNYNYVSPPFSVTIYVLYFYHLTAQWHLCAPKMNSDRLPLRSNMTMLVIIISQMCSHHTVRVEHFEMFLISHLRGWLQNTKIRTLEFCSSAACASACFRLPRN